MMSDKNYKVQDEELIRADIAGYLKKHEEKDLLRLITCGSVDDGKSTLIGRLLYDSKMIYEDQLAAVTKDSKVHGTTGDDFDPALLTDGLKAEREQGITIDVAYRYFSTDKRKFIIADCPGHEQYTRNMATGASTANLSVILVDARHGVITQTKRHSFICSLLGIKHVVVAVNKMDLIDWSEEVYEKIRSEYNAFSGRLGFVDVHFIPMSALKGDNVVDRSESMPWYEGPTFLSHLESVNSSSDRNLIDMRFPVQHVLRPNLDFRGFSGTVASGVVRVGDEVMSLPSRQTSKVKSIVTYDGNLKEACAPMAVTVTLADEIDVSRGNMLVPVNNIPNIGNEFEAMIVWMHEQPAKKGRSYLIKQTTNLVPGVLTDVRYKVDVNNMRKMKGEAETLSLNEIGRAHMTLHRPIAFDAYDKNRATGAFIIVDRMSNVTVGAGMIVDRVVSKKSDNPKSQNITATTGTVTRADREQMLGQTGATIWLTGLSGSGKSTIAQELEKQLTEAGHLCYILDGDNVRHGLNKDLGFSAEDRSENIRRIAEVAKLMNDAGVIVITSFISPYRADRIQAKAIVNGEGASSPQPLATSPNQETNSSELKAKSSFVEVFVDTPLEVCEQRDPKGLYKKVRAGQIPQFTGITDPYEIPAAPDVTLPTADKSVIECAEQLFTGLKSNGTVRD
jgi:bifunctional enzyme CysN/CysC